LDSAERNPDDVLDLDRVRLLLGRRACSFSIELRERCASSNLLLVDAAERGAPHRTVITCERQSAGRGRRGRPWISAGDGGLAFSLLWRFGQGAPAPAGLSLAAGVAVARAVESFGAGGVGLKWPNDVLLAGRKLSGILVELVPDTARATQAAVIGVGINLRLPEGFGTEHGFVAVDLAHALNPPPRRADLLAALLHELDRTLDCLAELGFASLREEWLARNAFQDLPVRLIGERDTLEGLCRGVDVDGALLLETPEGLQRIISGEVSLR
jgi:BirA family biotin operon repressor/biotin-[acetyl-CoA-carboxylase] ligase